MPGVIMGYAVMVSRRTQFGAEVLIRLDRGGDTAEPLDSIMGRGGNIANT